MINYKRYAVIYAITVFTVYMVISVLQNLIGIAIPAAGAIFAAPISASMDAGQRFYTQNKTIPANSDAWRAALNMAFIGMGVLSAFYIVELFLNVPQIDTLPVGQLLKGFVKYVIVVGCISVPIQRFMFTFAAKNAKEKEK